MIEHNHSNAAALRRGETSPLQWLVIEYGTVLHRRRSRQGFPEPAESAGRYRVCSCADDFRPTQHRSIRSNKSAPSRGNCRRGRHHGDTVERRTEPKYLPRRQPAYGFT
jgi:hypothetical protein